jgi:hypothetical protein
MNMKKMPENLTKLFSSQWNFFQPEQNETEPGKAGACQVAVVANGYYNLLYGE